MGIRRMDPERRANPLPLVLAALAGLAWAVIAVVFASLAPPQAVPPVFSSSHIRHFVAFYIITLMAAAALPTIKLRDIGAAAVVFALLLEVLRMIVPTGRQSRIGDAISDLGGIWSALAPIVVGKLRLAYQARRRDAASVDS
jgi:VanZ family protein